MNIKYNYINLVALGNFNPAIISPNFIKDNCGLNLGELTEQSPPFVPVLKKLQFENVLITVDLERLELKETKVSDDLETEVLEIFNSFYQVLPYTPLTAVGVNINCRLLFVDNEESGAIEKKVASPESYIHFFGVKQVHVNETAILTETEKTWIGSSFVIDAVNRLTRRIDLRREKDSLILNYNHEAGNLRESKMNRDIRLKNLFEGYGKFRNEFLDFIKYLEVNQR